MVQFVVQEMKAMNRRMDQLSELVNLEDEDLDYEEGELEHGDADRESIVSLDTKVNELTKAREAGNKKSKSTSAVHDIAQDLDLSEKTRSAVDEFVEYHHFKMDALESVIRTWQNEGSYL